MDKPMIPFPFFEFHSTPLGQFLIEQEANDYFIYRPPQVEQRRAHLRIKKRVSSYLSI